MLLAVLLGCRGDDSRTNAPVPPQRSEAGAEATSLATTRTAGHNKPAIKPLQIRRMCVVDPPARTNNKANASKGFVWIKTVFVDETQEPPRPIAFSFRCDWHDNDDDVTSGRVRRASWTCEQKELALDSVSGGLNVLTIHNVEFGQISAEAWFGTAKVELYEREFVVDHIGTLILPGRFTLTCPRPLTQLPGLVDAYDGRGDRTLTAGCEVAIENEPTHRRITAPCDGQFEVPGVYVDAHQQ